MYFVVYKLFVEYFNGMFVFVSYNGVCVAMPVSGLFCLVWEFVFLVNKLGRGCYYKFSIESVHLHNWVHYQ